MSLRGRESRLSQKPVYPLRSSRGYRAAVRRQRPRSRWSRWSPPRGAPPASPVPHLSQAASPRPRPLPAALSSPEDPLGSPVLPRPVRGIWTVPTPETLGDMAPLPEMMESSRASQRLCGPRRSRTALGFSLPADYVPSTGSPACLTSSEEKGQVTALSKSKSQQIRVRGDDDNKEQ